MFRIRHLSLRSSTEKSTYGADVVFNDGLNIINAPNTSGKSTFLQAILYALGLERMLGPRLDVPLPYAMRERIHSDKNKPYEKVVHSYVEMSLQNSRGESLLIRRDVTGGANRKLVRTWASGWKPSVEDRSVSTDFFLHDPGAAQHEAGFHHFLAAFIGWEIPRVVTFDGREVPLYVEALFPLMFVEQKKGWSTVQGPFPTHLGIQDVARRVMEFILDLDVGAKRRRRAEIRQELSRIHREWDKVVTGFVSTVGGFIRAPLLSAKPTAEFANVDAITLEYFWEGEWVPVAELMDDFQKELRSLEASVVRTAEDVAPELEREQQALQDKVAGLRSSGEMIRREAQTVRDDIAAVLERISFLEQDLVRNEDAAKLVKLGSVIGIAAGSGICPACHQELASELLPGEVRPVMTLDENIRLIKSQIKLYSGNREILDRRFEDLQVMYRSNAEQVREAQHRIRQLGSALQKASGSLDKSRLERVVELESLLRRLTDAQARADSHLDDLKALSKEFISVSSQYDSVKGDTLTTGDLEKLAAFTNELRELASRFGYTTFGPNEIFLSQDSFRPIQQVSYDGSEYEREIGFEMSASDSVRLKWAYYLALLAISLHPKGNHPGVLVFDEPDQQAVEGVDVSSFLKWMADNSGGAQFIVAATTEKVAAYLPLLEQKGASITNFDGYVLRELKKI